MALGDAEDFKPCTVYEYRNDNLPDFFERISETEVQCPICKMVTFMPTDEWLWKNNSVEPVFSLSEVSPYWA